MDAPLLAGLIALETQLLRGEIRADAARLDALLDDDFREIGASGRAFGKDEVLGRLPGEAAPQFEPRDFEGRLLAVGLAQLCYRLAIVRPGEGGIGYSLRSSLWRRADAGWRMVFHQGTPTAPFEEGGGSSA
jgi:hypothetical protein